jgi:type IV pilus assembly protein PilY1
MRHLWKRASVFLSVIILAFGGLCSSAYSNCENGNALPPFLVTGSVDPNLLLFIDNSASMYDLAYINETRLYLST